MKVSISSDFRRASDDIEHFENIIPGITKGDLSYFSQTSGLLQFPPNSKACGSVYSGEGQNLFDEVLLGRTVRLFQSPWGRAFLRQTMNKLSGEEGKFHMATVGNRAAIKNRMWSPEALEDFYKCDALSVSSKEQVVTLPGAKLPQCTESVLDWYLANASAMIIFDVLLRANVEAAHFERSSDVNLEFLYDSAERIVGGSRKRLLNKEGGSSAEGAVGWMADATDIAIESELNRSLKAQAYYIGGIAYKQPVLKYIVEECSEHNEGLRMLDFGGGYGLLTAEMCLDPDSGVELAVCRDVSPANFAFAAKIYRDLRTQLKDKFYFSLGKSEDFTFEGTFHVISFVGSLLYSPVDVRQAMLERCWDHLESGGILVIHENIKHPSYTADYERMFTQEAIDELLGKFGSIRRFLSTTIGETSKEDAAERSVFRVVRKP